MLSILINMFLQCLHNKLASKGLHVQVRVNRVKNSVDQYKRIKVVETIAPENLENISSKMTLAKLL